MNSVTEYLTLNVSSRRGFVNITSQVEKIVRKSGIKEGLCLVNAMHITSSVFINDNETGLTTIMKDGLNSWLHMNQ